MSGLRGRRVLVLVLEDEFLIAVDLVQMLEEIGLCIVGPAASLEAAQRPRRGGAGRARHPLSSSPPAMTMSARRPAPWRWCASPTGRTSSPAP